MAMLKFWMFHIPVFWVVTMCVDHIFQKQTFIGDRDRQYLESSVTISELYDSFIQFQRDADEPECSLDFFTHIFKNRMDLRIDKPKTDCCDVCEELKAEKKLAQQAQSPERVC